MACVRIERHRRTCLRTTTIYGQGGRPLFFPASKHMCDLVSIAFYKALLSLNSISSIHSFIMVRQSALALLIISVLSSHIYHAYAVNFLCLWCCKDPGDEPPNPPAKPTDYRRCKNRPIGPDSHMWAPDGGWACDQSKVDFPTVEVRHFWSVDLFAGRNRNARQCIQG